MEYYRIKHDYYDRRSGYQLIENELITEREMIKKNLVWIPNEIYELVNISKRNVFWHFGVRFEYKGEKE